MRSLGDHGFVLTGVEGELMFYMFRRKPFPGMFPRTLVLETFQTIRVCSHLGLENLPCTGFTL